MEQDTRLLEAFRRASALSRREMHRRREADGGEHTPHLRGMGHILECLSLEEGKSQQTLSRELGIRPQSLSQALNLLEERGEIRREVSPLDRRVTLVFSTPKGQEERARQSARRAAHAEAFFSVLTEEEKAELFRLLNKISTPFEGEQEEFVCRHL